MLEQGAKKLPLHALKASAFMHKAACKTAKRKWSLIAQRVFTIPLAWQSQNFCNCWIFMKSSDRFNRTNASTIQSRLTGSG